MYTRSRRPGLLLAWSGRLLISAFMRGVSKLLHPWLGRLLASAVSSWFATSDLRAQLAPVVFTHPLSLTVSAGSTTVLSVDATGTSPLRFQWRRNGTPISGADAAWLVLTRPAVIDGGRFDCVVSNAYGADTSRSATLEVVPDNGDGAGRLINLSVLTVAGAGPRALTLGTVVGPLTQTEPLALLVRAVGPTLGAAPFNLSEVLPDPQLVLFRGEQPIGANDDWGGQTALSSTFAAVGAFALPVESRDSAVLLATPGANAGNYTVQVTGKAGQSGVVIAELYDAAGASRGPATARLINLSTLNFVEGENVLAAGFVIGGRTGRTMLVRAVGPTLSAPPFNVPGVLPDPVLELFARSGVRLGGNNDWGGHSILRTMMATVGAFPLAAADGKDAVLLVSLPPGDYTAQVSGFGSGLALLEVYEVP